MQLFMTVLIALGLTLPLLAADGEVDLPLAARNVLSTLERNVKSLQEKAAADLKSIMKNEAQAGRMDKVLAMNDLIKELEERIAEPALNAKAGRAEDQIIGRWEIQHSQFELTFAKGNRFTAKLGDRLNWQGSWEIKDNKLFVSHPVTSSKDVFTLPPQKEMENGRSVYKLYGHTDKGEPRILVKRSN